MGCSCYPSSHYQFNEILRLVSKAAENTQSCFALDTEHKYWTVGVQSLWRVKKILMTSNIFPLHFAPT